MERRDGHSCHVRGINSSGAVAGCADSESERRRVGRECLRGCCDGSGEEANAESLSGDPCADNDDGDVESLRCITSQVERGFSSRLTRSKAACEQ